MCVCVCVVVVVVRTIDLFVAHFIILVAEHIVQNSGFQALLYLRIRSAYLKWFLGTTPRNTDSSSLEWGQVI